MILLSKVHKMSLICIEWGNRTKLVMELDVKNEDVFYHRTNIY